MLQHQTRDDGGRTWRPYAPIRHKELCEGDLPLHHVIDVLQKHLALTLISFRYNLVTDLVVFSIHFKYRKAILSVYFISRWISTVAFSLSKQITSLKCQTFVYSIPRCARVNSPGTSLKQRWFLCPAKGKFYKKFCLKGRSGGS